ncbi:hypothetical protein LMI01_04610 [Companilactobacillus mindensis]|nr:hypothetical protein LMI01_04610 [Companilactobacillus mindensis]
MISTVIFLSIYSMIAMIFIISTDKIAKKITYLSTTTILLLFAITLGVIKISMHFK